MHKHLAAVVALLLLPLASAGSADDPDWTDPAGDQAVTGGGTLGRTTAPESFDGVDLLDAWVDLTGTQPVVTIRSSATPTGTTTLTYQVRSTDASIRFPDEPWSANFTLAITDTSVTGNASAQVVNESLVLTLPAIVPGDELRLTSLVRSDSEPGAWPVVTADQAATDTFEGDARAAGSNVSVDARAALAINERSGGLDVTLTNTGTHPDIFTAAGGTYRLLPTEAVELDLDHAESGPAAIRLDVTSHRGAEASTYWAPAPDPVPLQPASTAAPPEDDPTGMARLEPMASAMGLGGLGAGGPWVLVALASLILTSLGFLVLRRRKVQPMARPEPQPLDPEKPLMEATVETRAVAIPGKPTLVLDGVEHSRDRALPGEEVDSSVTIENKGALGARIMARLVLGDRILGEQTVAVPARQRVRVKVPWTGGSQREAPRFELYPA